MTQNRVASSIALGGLLSACGGPMPAAVGTSGEALAAAVGRARAGAAVDDVLVVDWPTSTRKRLEAELGTGPVAVVIDAAGGLTLHTDCRPAGTYTYRGVTPTESAIRFSGAGGERAGLPTVGGVHLGAAHGASGAGALHRLQVGRFALADAAGLALPSGPACAPVTHVVESAEVGAFVWTRQDRSEGTAGLSIAQVAAELSRSGAADEVLRDGDPARCGTAASGDAAPPSGCGALLSIRLRPAQAGVGAGAGAEAADAVAERMAGRWYSVTETTTPGDGDDPPTVTRTAGETVFVPGGSTTFEGVLEVTTGGTPALQVRYHYRAAGEWRWDGRLTEKLLDLKTSRTEVFLDGRALDADAVAALSLPAPEALIPLGQANVAAVRFVDDDHLEILREEGVERYERR
jgi:hypothetical protein